MQVIGKLEEVHDLVQRTASFSVREFVLEIGNPQSQYTEHVLFQLTNQRTTLVDQFQVGQEIVVDFDLQGRKWTNPEGRIVFFNRLNAWRISPYDAQAMQGGYPQQPAGAYQQPPMGGGYPQQQPYGAQPMGGGYPQQQPYGAQPMGGGYQQPMPAPAQAPVQPAPAANNSNDAGDDDLPF